MTPAPSNSPPQKPAPSIPLYPAVGTRHRVRLVRSLLGSFPGPQALSQNACLGLGRWVQGAERREDQREHRWDGGGEWCQLQGEGTCQPCVWAVPWVVCHVSFYQQQPSSHACCVALWGLVDSLLCRLPTPHRHALPNVSKSWLRFCTAM